MLSNIFQNTLIELVDRKIDVEQSILQSILEYIQKKDINTYVFPEKIQEVYEISLKSIFEIFILLEKKNILKQVYKLYCPTCREFSSNIYDSFNEIEDNCYCEYCDQELFDEENPYKYIIVYFKVIKNG